MKDGENAVVFSYNSPDGENGFPGNLKISVTYTLKNDNSLQISYDGISDKKTIINMTNHSYFNLAGHDAGSICDEKMMIDADAFTELGQGSICTGKVIPVEGTPMDFRTARRVGDHIDDAWPQLTLAGGYDHNWVLPYLSPQAMPDTTRLSLSLPVPPASAVSSQRPYGSSSSPVSENSPHADLRHSG